MAIANPAENLRALFAYVDGRQAESVELLCTLVRQPSVSAQDIGVDEYASLIAGVMRDSGLETRLLPTPGRPVVFGQRPVGTDRATILIYGHYDVQPAELADGWQTPPFEPVVRDGRLYGRGSADNKGQHLAQLLALRAWLAVAGELPLNVKVILEGEEEIGSPHLAAFAEEHRELLAADVVYTSDGSLHDSGRPTVVLGVRGNLYVELRARGPASDVHSGNKGGITPNPAWELVHLLATMLKPDGQVTIEGFDEAVRPPTAAERAAVAALPLDLPKQLASIGVDHLPPPEGLGYYERLMFRPTLTISGFHSGYGGPGVKTIVPASATAKLDVRLVPDQDPDGMFELLARHVAAHAPNVELVRLSSFYPSRTSLEHPLAQAVIAGVADAWGQPPLIVPSLGGSLPDRVFTGILGLPSLLVPYANADQGNHGPNENFVLANFIQGIKTCAAVLASVGRS